MRPFPGAVLLGGLAALLAVDAPANAAWNNVFQVSCFRNRRTVAGFGPSCCPTPVVAAAPPCPQPCPPPCPPQPQCTTSYVQRCYYAPVTTYKQECRTEAVVSYRTSFFWEPVTTTHVSCFYDPCTCSYKKVETPVTSFRLRSRCDPVTTYLQRTHMVPVTSFQLRHYFEPVTTCCSTTVGAPVAAPPSGLAPTPAPGIGEQQFPGNGGARPRVGEDPGVTDAFRPRETNPPPMSGAYDPSSRQPRLRSPEPVQPVSPPPPADPKPPRARLDRIGMLDTPNVEGKVVRADSRTPNANVRLLFVNADQDGEQKTVTADGDGRFQASLARGNWLVYVRNREGTPVFQKRVVVHEGERIPMMLTSR